MIRHILFMAVFTLTSVFTMVYAPDAHALTIKCKNEFFKKGPSYSAVAVDHMLANCSDKAGHYFQATVSGAGPSLGIAAETTFLMSCPRASKVTGDYYGAKISLAAVLGFHVAAVANQQGQMCFIIGGDTNALQAGFTIDKIEVRDRRLTQRERDDMAYRARWNKD